MILYTAPGACSRVTLTALEEIGVDFENRTLDLASGEQTSAEYLTVNRKGKVPAMVIDGKLLTENAAILGFLHNRYPDAKLLPTGNDAFGPAQGISDITWCATTLHPEVRQVRAPFKWTTGDPAGVKADGIVKFAKECAYISERVGDAGWWYGDTWSIVDTYVYWAYSTARIGGFPLEDYPRLLAHAERVRARPSFQRARAREIDAIEQMKLPIDPATL